MSNFKYNITTTTDITCHPRTVIRTDIEPNCSRPLKDFGFEDSKNSELRVLTGGTFYTAVDGTTDSSAKTIEVPSSSYYITSNKLNTLYDLNTRYSRSSKWPDGELSNSEWPVGVFPLRDGSPDTWTAHQGAVRQFTPSARSKQIKLIWDAEDTLFLYENPNSENSNLVDFYPYCPQFMVDIQAPGGKGGNGISGDGFSRAASGGGGGAGGFATILFTKACGGVLLEQNDSGDIVGYIGSNLGTYIGVVRRGGDASGTTGGVGGSANVFEDTGVYIINKITGGGGGNGYTAVSWHNNEAFPGESNELLGSHGYGCGGSGGLLSSIGGYISLSPRRVDDSPYMESPGCGASAVQTVHYKTGNLNLYPGGGGGGSVLGNGGSGQISGKSSVAQPGVFGGGGGGGGTKLLTSWDATGADGGDGRIIFYIPPHIQI